MKSNFTSDQKMHVGGKTAISSRDSISRLGSVIRRKSTFANYVRSRDIDGDLINQRNDISNILTSNQFTLKPPEKSPDGMDKFVYFGDIIHISWTLRDIDKFSKSSGVLYGEKYANFYVQFKLSKDGFINLWEEGCLFQIVNRSEKIQETENIIKQQMLIERRDIFTHNDTKKANDAGLESETKVRLLYGQGFSLKHIASGKYLSLKPFLDNSTVYNAKEEPKQTFSRFILTSDEDVDTYFKFYPTNTLSQIGCPMDYEESIFFKDEIRQMGYTIKLPDSKFDEAKLTINSNETTEWKFSFYSDASYFNSSRKDNLKRGDIIQIFDSESQEYLICEAKNFSLGKKGRIYFPIESKPSSMPCIEVHEITNVENETYEVKFVPDAQNSVYSFWQVKCRKPFDNGHLINEDEIHLINLITNTYLSLRTNNSESYSLVSVSIPGIDITNSFQILNQEPMVASKQIDINSQFKLTAKTDNQIEQKIDVMASVFKQTTLGSFCSKQDYKHSTMSMKKITHHSRNYLTIIDLKFCFERLHEFFSTWGTKSFTQSLNAGDTTETNVNYYKFDHDFAAKIKYAFTEKLDEFNLTLKILRDMLLVDYASFVDIEEGLKLNSALSSKLSEQIYESHTIRILIEILHISMARFYSISKIIATDFKDVSEDMLKNYDGFLDLERSLRQNETREKIAPIDAMENYEKLICLILKFLSRFSYKNKHIQANILDKIETIFPLLAFYKEMVKAILGNVLTAKTHPRIHYLQSAVLRKFTDGGNDTYLSNVGNMYNMIAKSIKHNEVPLNVDAELHDVKSKLKDLLERMVTYKKNIERARKIDYAEAERISNLSAKKSKRQSEKKIRTKIKHNTHMDKIQKSKFDLNPIQTTEPVLPLYQDINQTTITVTIHQGDGEQPLDTNSVHIEGRSESNEATQAHIHKEIQKEINLLKIKEEELEKKQFIRDRIRENPALKSKVLIIEDDSVAKDPDPSSNQNDVTINKEQTPLQTRHLDNRNQINLARIGDEDKDKVNLEEDSNKKKYDFKLSITPGRLIRRFREDQERAQVPNHSHSQ